MTIHVLSPDLSSAEQEAHDLLSSSQYPEVWIYVSDTGTLYVWANGDNGPECMLSGPESTVISQLSP